MQHERFVMKPGVILANAAALSLAVALSMQSAAAAPALATTNVNLRNGPGTTYTVITTIPGGSNVDVSGCNAGWCQVSFQGQNGFVIATSLDHGGGGAPIPVAPGAPPPGYIGPPVAVAPPPYYYGYGPYYYGYGPYYGWRGGYWHRRW